MDSSVVRERKKTLVRVCANAGDESYHAKSLLKLVQVWTWERFQNLWREIPKGFILMIPSGIHMLIKNLYRTGTLLGFTLRKLLVNNNLDEECCFIC